MASNITVPNIITIARLVMVPIAIDVFTREWTDVREEMSTTAALTPTMEGILDASRAMHDLLRRPGGGHGCAGSSH